MIFFLTSHPQNATGPIEAKLSLTDFVTNPSLYAELVEIG